MMKTLTVLILSAGLMGGSLGAAVAQDQTPPSGAAATTSPMNAPAEQMGRSSTSSAVTPFAASPSAKAMPSPKKDADSTANTRAND